MSQKLKHEKFMTFKYDTHLCAGVRPQFCCLVALCNRGFIFCERMSDCLGLDGGGIGYGARIAGPARDMRP